MSLNHPDFCELCGFIGEKCGSCSGNHWKHMWIVCEVTGTYQPRKVRKPVLKGRR